MSDFSLWGLFVSAFISATLFPGGSEAVLAYLAYDDHYSMLILLSVATLGNTLGGMSSWFIGWLIALRYPATRLSGKQHLAIQRVQRWGSPLLLFSWLPVAGDPLCVAAGWLGIRWWQALLFIAVGKALRYWVIIALFSPLK